MKLTDLRLEGETFFISLSKLCGRTIADIHGYITNEFGYPTFKMCKIVFTDGTELGCEGEHDIPYVVPVWQGDRPLPDDETLRALMDEEA